MGWAEGAPADPDRCPKRSGPEPAGSRGAAPVRVAKRRGRQHRAKRGRRRTHRMLLIPGQLARSWVRFAPAGFRAL